MSLLEAAQRRHCFWINLQVYLECWTHQGTDKGNGFICTILNSISTFYIPPTHPIKLFLSKDQQLCVHIIAQKLKCMWTLTFRSTHRHFMECWIDLLHKLNIWNQLFVFFIQAPNLADVLTDILGTKVDIAGIENSYPGGRGSHFSNGRKRLFNTF